MSADEPEAVGVMPAIVAPTPARAPEPAIPAAEQAVPATATPHDVRNRLLATVVVILVLYTCAIAEAIIVPVLVAILFGLMLAPPVRLLERWGIPRVIGSLAAVLMTLAIAFVVLAALTSPARDWMQRMPRALDRIEQTLRDVRRPFQVASEATRELGKLTDMGEAPTVRVIDASPGPLAQAMSAAPAVLAGIIVTILLTFLFLLHGDALLRKFVALAPHLRAKRELVEATRHAQSELSMYVITITLINAGLGLATAATLWLLHVPDPLLWGGIAAVLNYAPFIGPTLTAIVLTMVGFGQFNTAALALAPPAAFLGLHLLEGQLLTPHLVGRRLSLDPVVVFLALIALGWMWGVAGLLLAVPMLSCAKIIAERTENGHVLATLLSR
jgi:predicted PurR-regulated permease PerM